MDTFQKKYWERKDLDIRRPPWHPCVKEYVVPKIQEIKKIIPLNKEVELLDVGCGNGFFGYYFDKICKTTGVDYSKKMIELNPIKNKYIMDANDLKFEDNSFDIVFCHALLHHLENPNKAIKEMKRVSKKYVVMLEPNRNNPLIFLYVSIVKEERKALKFSLSYLKNTVKKNNLKIITSFSYGMVMPNKTPVFLLSLVKLFNFKQPLGMTNCIISEKK